MDKNIKQEKPPKELPLGTGKRIIKEREKLAQEALEVKNNIVYVNPAFRGTMPFDLQYGKPVRLGVFFTLRPEVCPEEVPRRLTLLPESRTRSGQLGSVIFRDNKGRLYRDVDAKGIGFVKIRYIGTSGETSTMVRGIEIHDPQRQTAWGLLDYGYAERERQMSDKFLRAGIRTNAVLGITFLEEIIDKDGNRISIEEAKKHGLIPADMQPVIEFRAFGTRERLDVSSSSEIRSRSEAILEDAKTLVAQELGRDPKTFSTHEYLVWFARTLGRQIAKIRKLKMHHGNFPRNITADCRIVDLDSVDFVKNKVENKVRESGLGHDFFEKQLYDKEFSEGWHELSHLISGARGITSDINILTEDNYKQLYQEAYEDELRGN